MCQPARTSGLSDVHVQVEQALAFIAQRLALPTRESREQATGMVELLAYLIGEDDDDTMDRVRGWQVPDAREQSS